MIYFSWFDDLALYLEYYLMYEHDRSKSRTPLKCGVFRAPDKRGYLR